MRTLAALLLLSVAGTAPAEPPPQCTLPPRDGAATDARLAALERRVAELCERLDRPAPSAGGTEAQSVATNFVVTPQVAYSAACGPGGCTAPTAAYGPIVYPGASWGPGVGFGMNFQSGAATSGCAGGSCGAAAPAGGFLRGGLFRGRR
jgi:hypothetical protein